MPKISSDELSAHAYKKVKSMILSKKLMPGKKIVQDKLAEELGISRTPLRSALQMLEAEYLVESIPRRGMIVKQFSERERIEIFDCRVALEATAVRLFTAIASPADIDRLEKLFEPFMKKNKKIDAVAYKQADIKFHDSIIRKCGNAYLYHLFKKGNLLNMIDLIGLVRSAEETLKEHQDIIEAIKKRNADLAEKCMKKHLEKSKQLLLSAQKKHTT